MKRSRIGDPTPEGGGTTPEGSLTLVSSLKGRVVNIGLDILGNLNNLNITKYWAEVSKFLYWTNFKKEYTTIVTNLQKLFNMKIVH